MQSPGAIYQVMNRGDRRDEIFQSDNDRRLLLGSFLFGCTTPRGSGSTKALLISEAQAVAIATKEATENRKWSNFRVVSVRLVDADTWRILLERLPPVPGAHASVEVSAKDGKIIGWYPGA